ncbi:MAG: homoserine dehydrogenase, partial [Betaproteobacteria bacterium]|nr:homoserine dehydrogenase [Betaproteobacteria bacterium]
ITRILADGGISLDAVLQPEPQAGERQTDVILLTHCCLEAAVDAAVVRIESLPTVLSTAIRLRLEDLD